MAHHLPRLLVLLFLGAHVSHGSHLPPTAYDDSMCSESFRCGGVDIRYPFYLSNATRAAPEHTSNFSCGYTDLNISCLAEGKTGTPVLHLDEYSYIILNISYDNHTIILRDADLLRGNDDCPRVSHNVSFGQDWLNYTDSADSLAFFFDCYTKPGDDMPRGLKDYQINCKGFSSPGVSFVFSSEKVDASEHYELAYHCANYFLAPVHEDALLRSDPPVLPSQYGVLLRRGFELEWNHSTAQPCHLCEHAQSAGRCAYSENKEFLGCLCSGGKVDDHDCNSSNATTASANTPSSHRLLLVLLLSVAAASGENYDPSMCLNQPYRCGSLNISYPFYLAEETRDLKGSSNSYCGYPGLGITCYDGTPPVLEIDGGDNYTVTSIQDRTANLSFADPDVVDQRCPRVDQNVSFGPSAWLDFPPSTVDYLVFFLGCYFKPGVQLPTIGQILCPGFHSGYDGQSFLFPDDSVPDGNWAQDCQQVIKVPVLNQGYINPNDTTWRNTGYGEVLRQGFQVSWDNDNKPSQCAKCEESYGRCAYNEAGEFVGCLCGNGQIKNKDCRSKKNIRLIAGVVAGVAGLLLVAGIAVFLFRKRKQRKVVNSSSKLLKYSGSGGTPTRSRDGFDMESGSIQDMGSRFSYEELEEATDSFDEKREIGDGGFGTVYKGYLVDGRVVAVKRLYNNSYRRVEQFVNEAAILARLRHPNLVMFYGCTSKESRELLLVYEFVQNGTVADHLHGHRAQERALPWPLRLNIAIESAAALTYLHAIEPPIVHRDVKTNNILLDTDFHVKVADFGLSRLFPLDVTHVSTAPQGTPGYVDPEYHQCYQLTDKSDVYSFGVVLVELISSKPAVDITRQRSEINLASMAINRIQKCQLEQLVDLELGYQSDPTTRKMMTMVAELAFRCLQQNSEMRPPIKEVHDVLRAIKEGSLVEKDGGGKDKDLVAPFSPDTVHAPWDSRSTTPNTSQ